MAGNWSAEVWCKVLRRRIERKQKTSVNLGRWRCKLPAQKWQKFFAPLFFKKAAFFSNRA
jgi:hypothetical protein